MEIYLSVGVAALVALMAAHRSGASGDRSLSTVLDRGDFAGIGTDSDAGIPLPIEPDPALW
jgi:hypothetical protein